MIRGYCLDLESKVVAEHYAVIYAPKRRRDRFPENCVEVFESEALARDNADKSAHRFAAKVAGPARSSEGLRLFYLVRWLGEE